MTVLFARLADPRADAWLGATACAAVGAAGFLAMGALLSDSLVLGVAAGGVGATALGLLLTAGWINPLGVLAVSLPLPALVSTTEGRLPPVLLIGGVVATAWMLGRATDVRPLAVRWSSIGPLALLAGATAVSALFAEARVAAVREVVNFALLVALLAVTLDLVRARPRRAESVVTWVVLGAAIAGATAVIETLGGGSGRFPLPGSALFRAAGGFGWPNELGMFLAIVFPLALYRAAVASGLRRLGWGAAVGLVALGLAATFSRGSWLSVAVAPAVLFTVGEGRTALRIWVAGILTAALVDIVTGGAIVTRVVGTTGDVLVGQRLLLSAAGLLMFQAHPVVGVGPGGFGEALERFGPQIAGLFDFVGSAHNGYVHIAAEVGILGLLGLLAFLGTTWWRLLGAARRSRAASRERSRAVAILWAFTTVALVSLFEWPFAHGVAELIILVAGLGLAGADGGVEET